MLAATPLKYLFSDNGSRLYDSMGNGELILEIKDGNLEINCKGENVLKFQELCNLEFRKLKEDRNKLRKDINKIKEIFNNFYNDGIFSNISKMSDLLDIEYKRIEKICKELEEHRRKENLKRYAFMQK